VSPSQKSSETCPWISHRARATLEDVRAEVLTPDRLNTVVFGVFAGVALAIALVGVAGVLAFSVSARTGNRHPPRSRLAAPASPRRSHRRRRHHGHRGVVAGAAGGYLLARFAGSYSLTSACPAPYR